MLAVPSTANLEYSRTPCPPPPGTTLPPELPLAKISCAIATFAPQRAKT